jgi:structural maintenance of chromosome 4
LVEKDLEQANRIAFGGNQRWRVVTLAGQLIDTSGTMSGGGAKVLKGAMSSKLASDSVDPSTLRRYEKDSEELAAMVDSSSAELKKFEQELDESNRKGPQLDLKIEKLELELKTVASQVLEAVKQSEDLE